MDNNLPAIVLHLLTIEDGCIHSSEQTTTSSCTSLISVFCLEDGLAVLENFKSAVTVERLSKDGATFLHKGNRRKVQQILRKSGSNLLIRCGALESENTRFESGSVETRTRSLWKRIDAALGDEIKHLPVMHLGSPLDDDSFDEIHTLTLRSVINPYEAWTGYSDSWLLSAFKVSIHKAVIFLNDKAIKSLRNERENLDEVIPTPLRSVLETPLIGGTVKKGDRVKIVRPFVDFVTILAQ